jgi:hypothetical protein
MISPAVLILVLCGIGIERRGHAVNCINRSRLTSTAKIYLSPSSPKAESLSSNESSSLLAAALCEMAVELTSTSSVLPTRSAESSSARTGSCAGCGACWLCPPDAIACDRFSDDSHRHSGRCSSRANGKRAIKAFRWAVTATRNPWRWRG